MEQKKYTYRTAPPPELRQPQPQQITALQKILMSLVASITYPTNGTYDTTTVEFTSNDQDPAFSIPSKQTVTATVTVYMEALSSMWCQKIATL